MSVSSLLFGILIGISLNFDNMGVGVAYGVRNARIPWLFCLLTALSSFTACFVGNLTGSKVTKFMPESTGVLMGSFILIAIGLWVVYQSFSYGRENAGSASTTLGFNDMMFIGLAQSLSDLAVGFGAGFANLNVFTTSLSVGVFSALFLLAPSWLSIKFVPQKLGQGTALLSGIVVIVVGLWL